MFCNWFYRVQFNHWTRILKLYTYINIWIDESINIFLIKSKVKYARETSVEQIEKEKETQLNNNKYKFKKDS